MSLKGKIAIVTGSASRGGIGRAIALRLAKEGTDVVVADIDMEQGGEVVGEIKTLGRRALLVKTDVTMSQDTNLMAETALKEFGKIDILVNAAGGDSWPRWKRRFLFHESTEEVWDFIIALNYKSVLNCCKAVIEHMMERQSGKIVSIASTAGVVGTPGTAEYSGAKAAVIGFTRTLAKEVGQYGINVNCISPGPIATATYPKTEELWEKRRQTMALRRMGTPEEIASMVACLVSDDASYMTGQNVIVCGGRSLGD